MREPLAPAKVGTDPATFPDPIIPRGQPPAFTTKRSFRDHPQVLVNPWRRSTWGRAMVHYHTRAFSSQPIDRKSLAVLVLSLVQAANPVPALPPAARPAKWRPLSAPDPQSLSILRGRQIVQSFPGGGSIYRERVSSAHRFAV